MRRHSLLLPDFFYLDHKKIRNGHLYTDIFMRISKFVRN